MSSTLRELVHAYLREQCEVIIDAEDRLRARESVVHPTRVALRRCRSTLRVFADLFDEPDAVQTGEAMRGWALILGTVRDHEVLHERLTAAVDALPPELVLGPVRRELVEQLQLRQRDGWSEIGTTLELESHRRLIADVRRWHSDPPFTAIADQPAEAVRPYLKKAAKRVRRRTRQAVAALQEHDPAADHLIHQARKAGKRHRYALELALPVTGEKGERRVAKRKAFQDLLGDHQDGVVAAAFLRAEAARLGLRTGHNGFTYGLLYAQQIEQARSVLSRLN